MGSNPAQRLLEETKVRDVSEVSMIERLQSAQVSNSGIRDVNDAVIEDESN